MSQRKIADDLGISRNTVASYIKEYDSLSATLFTSENLSKEQLRVLAEQIVQAPRYHVQNRHNRKYTEEIDSALDSILAEEETKTKVLGPHKQQLTNMQIHQLLVDEGFDIGLSTINNHIRQKRCRYKEAYIMQRHPLGKRFEFDFGEIKLVIAGKRRKLYIAVLTAPASKARFAYIYEKQNQDVVMDAHIRFFEWIGGVFEEGVYDNLKQVVIKHTHAITQFNERFLGFATYYGFALKACNVRSGNEKGFTERSVELIRNLAFARAYSFDSVDEANTYLKSQLIILNRDKNLEAERAHLKYLKPAFEIGEFIDGLKVDKTSCVTIHSVKYSVPDSFVGKSVSAKVYPQEIKILLNAQIIAQHRRCFTEQQVCLDIRHFLDTLAKKPGALQSSKVLQSTPRLKSVFDKYYLAQPKEFIHLMQKHQSGNIDEIIDALVSAKSINPSKESHETQNLIAQKTKDQIERLCKVVA